MFHKIQSVVALPGFVLDVTFESGERRHYAVGPLFEKWRAFQSLAQIPGLWARVRTDPGGYGVSWNDELDISCDELYHNGIVTA
jgi:hypothetical protein